MNTLESCNWTPPGICSYLSLSSGPFQLPGILFISSCCWACNCCSFTNCWFSVFKRSTKSWSSCKASWNMSHLIASFPWPPVSAGEQSPNINASSSAGKYESSGLKRKSIRHYTTDIFDTNPCWGTVKTNGKPKWCPKESWFHESYVWASMPAIPFSSPAPFAQFFVLLPGGRWSPSDRAAGIVIVSSLWSVLETSWNFGGPFRSPLKSSSNLTCRHENHLAIMVSQHGTLSKVMEVW